ncbi:hypothetical protein YPPY13_1263, partial [Yersinia pestis PY-13]
MVAGAGFEPT